ncbi:hypothetical protein SBA7_810007 [Candidatus Sulfotelmatobacter sp. SbA7]|nr:hypothetical protein SBA7_810007 [Candidatus Sulfotelmatobacter sp. SbA7]
MERAKFYRRDAEVAEKDFCWNSRQKLVANSQKPVSAPFLMQIGKANRCDKRFLFVCLRRTR